MIVCICAGASDREVRRAVEAGAGSLSELGELCDAGRDCGMCHSSLLEILKSDRCDDCPKKHGLPGRCSALDREDRRERRLA